MVNYAFDIQYDYNIKLFLLFTFLAISIFTLLYMQEYEVKYLYQYYIKYFAQIFAIVYLVAFPLWIFFLQRTVAIDAILQPMLIVYGGIMIIGLFMFYLFGIEKIKEFFTGDGFYRGKNK